MLVLPSDGMAELAPPPRVLGEALPNALDRVERVVLAEFDVDWAAASRHTPSKTTPPATAANR